MCPVPLAVGKSNSALLQNAFGGNPFDAVGNLKAIPPSALVPWDKNPFKPYSGERLQELADSIRDYGLMTPVIVRLIGSSGKYQILAGHNRVEACKLLGREDIMCRVLREIDDDQAAIIVMETNLKQRDQILPSEKAKAYKMLLDARRRQGRRTDMERATDEAFDKEREPLPDNIRQMQRFIRLNYLIEELLERVDDGKLPLRAGVALSYLSSEIQKKINYLLTVRLDLSVSIAQAENLKSLSENNEAELTEEVISQILLGDFARSSKNLEGNEQEGETKAKTGQGRNSKGYVKLLQDLRRDKIITASQRRDMESYIQRKMEEAQREAIRSYIAILGKGEELEAYLQDHQQQSETDIIDDMTIEGADEDQMGGE